jgi:hypothetical protein
MGSSHMDLRIVLDKWDDVKRRGMYETKDIVSWAEYAEEVQRVADETIEALLGANLLERRELDRQGRTFTCRFHPTDWWHEVGCPHMVWTKEQLADAEETRQKFFDQHIRPNYSKLFYGSQEWQKHVRTAGQTFQAGELGAAILTKVTLEDAAQPNPLIKVVKKP